MKIVDNMKENMSNIGVVFKLLKSKDKYLIFLLILESIFRGMLPFFGIYITKVSVDMFVNQYDYDVFVKKISIALTLMFVVKLLEYATHCYAEFRLNLNGPSLFGDIIRKSLEFDYEQIVDKEFIDKRQYVLTTISQAKFAASAAAVKEVLCNAFVVAGTVYVLYYLDLKILIVSLVFVALNTYMTVYKNKKEYGYQLKKAPLTRKLDYLFNVNLDTSYTKEIRMYNMKESFDKEFNNVTSDINDYDKKISKLSLAKSLMFAITEGILNIAVYVYLGYKVMYVKDISIGDFTMFVATIMSLNFSVLGMLEMQSLAIRCSYDFKAYFEFMDMETKFDKNENIPVPKTDEYIFEFKDVSFKYPNQNNWVLKDLNFTINGDEKIALLGENGAGKSTLIKLIMRLFEPTEGEILLNGVNINTLNYSEYLSMFSTVFQDYSLFAFKIVDNICSVDYGDYNIEKMNNALKKVGMYDKVNECENGYNTYMYKVYDDKGVEFSGGQTQKLAMARALYKDGKVMILDEPTSALDPRAEYEMYMDMLSMIENKSALFISHRLASAKFCDRIVMLIDGNIKENGTHDELMKINGGLYREFFEVQSNFYV